MASSPSTPAARDVFPAKLPPSQAITKLEGEETMMASEHQHSLSAPSERDGNESHSRIAGELSPSALLPSHKTAANTTGNVSKDAVHTRCVVNFLDPQPGECDSRITNDDRHYISNFFGRNKSCSTSIPDEFYQVLCRKCMQAMKYRLQSGKGATEIQVQVAAIKHALKNMAASRRWVFVEVQLTKTEYDRRQNPKQYEEEIRKFNQNIFKSREEAKQKGEKARRRNTKKAPPPVPDWLAEQVMRSDENPNQDYTPVHERHPTRWSFEDIIALVDMIGENCEVLPNIECLVVTQGELDRVDLEDAKMLRREAKRELQLLRRDVAGAEEDLKQNPKNEDVQAELQDYKARTAFIEKRLEYAEEEVKKASEVLEKTAHTIPPKREQLKKPDFTRGESSRTAMESEKKTNKSKTTRDDSQATIAEPGIEDAENAAVGSPAPTPGWEGKGKQKPSAQRSLAAETPSTPPPQIQEQTSATATTPGTPSSQTLTTAALVIPSQAASATSPSSTTRSTGRRLQLDAERSQAQQQPPQPQPSLQGQRVQKRKAAAVEEDERQQQDDSGPGVIDQESPRRKKAKQAASRD